MKLDLFDYKLPKKLIAQRQIKPRDKSRLLVLDRKTKKIRHDFFYNLDKYLKRDDVLVFNDTKVIPARIRFENKEIFSLNRFKGGEWEVMGRKIGIKNYELRSKNILLKCEIIKKLPNGNWLARFNYRGKKFRQDN